MVKIHVPGDGHTAPPPDAVATYNPYTDVKKKKVVEDALFILRNNVKGMASCNECFTKLPNGRTFADILDDDTIYICYDPSDRWCANTLGNNHITINEYSISRGRWLVAATLVHEFAHINGAPGTDHRAEATLPPCGMGANGLYDPTVRT
jgi:hypothetical protein